jgi:Flp pilus assembly protein TadD
MASEVHIRKGKELLDQGQIDAAIEQFQLTVEALPSHHEAVYLLGLAYLRSEHFPLALMQFDRALELSPNNPNYLSDRGVVKLRMKDQQGALHDLNRCVELDPNYSFRYSLRAFVRNAIGDIHGAMEDYEKAVSLDPTDPIAYNNLGLCQEQLGYQSQAERNFRMADKLEGIDRPDVVSDHTVSLSDKSSIATTELKTELEPSTYLNIIKRVFTDPNERAEFFRFTGNLFKLNRK